MLVRFGLSVLVSGVLLSTAALAKAPGEPEEHMWQPAADTVFLQDFNHTVATDAPVTAVAVYGGTAYGVMNGALYTCGFDGVSPAAGAPGGVQGLWGLGDALWVSTGDGVFRYAGAGWDRVFPEPMVDLCVHLDVVHGATREGIFAYDDGVFVDIKPETGYLSDDSTVIMADGSQVLTDPVDIGPIAGIASYSETLYIMQPSRIALLNDAQLVEDPIDFGKLPHLPLRDMVSHGSRLCFATEKGVMVLRGMALTFLDGEDRLPYEDVTCLASGFNGDLWIGTSTGAIRQTGDEFHYFGATHWLPEEGVNAIAVDGHTVYIATEGGLGIITYEPYTLAKKAAYFEQMMDVYGFKRMGFVHLIDWSAEHGEWIREISDNDGGHSSQYLAAMSYKYAATGDEDARREAVDTFKAMVWLESITPSDGFFARAIWSKDGDKGSLARHGSGGLPAKWYETDDGKWIWKGDTSSDEVNAHMYSVSVFYELAAKGDEKDRAAEHIARIAEHIIDNGWVLRDMDGQPTRWGRWDPDYLLEPYGFEARGLNGLEVQSYMWTAFGLTGDDDFLIAMKEQPLHWGYHHYTVRTKLTFPPDNVVPWDDLLAFRSYYPILMYADEPELRSIYMRSLERSWEILRMHQLPWFNFIYGVHTGNDCEVEEAVTNLRDFPMDPTSWKWRNSHRADLATEEGYVAYDVGSRAISPRETQSMWSSRNALQLNGGSGGTRKHPPIGWLEDYWMGRYYGFIEEPAVTDKDLTTVPRGFVKGEGAKPYAGTPRPENP